VSVPAPFSIASGASFSLLPGQPQEVVVKFSSATPGSFSKSISISSNAGSKTITATGIAHKVSFSPAQLDFGSGLLVLREQCNNMDVCGLRTEKVGLPIEKSLTVKNEGSVAVTLTLSTSAPYKIVSVLPTLSPGQSAQVTVRFDPSESGSFTGIVQVGINGGQGSVTSPPLVGVAHKVEIDPAVLNFRLIFTGRAGTLPFTVKNQGVTSVALTASTDGPFSIIGGNSFALAPSESRQITVQFSPTRSGDFTGSLRLSVGAATTVVPIAATSRTVAEFLQMLSNLNDPMSSVGNYYSMLYVENAGYQLDMILAGFARLTEEDLNNWLNSAPSLADSGAMPDPQLVEALLVLDSIGAETIVGWLSQLAQAVQENHFDEVYDNLLTQGFSQVEQAFMVLLGTSNGSEVRGFFLQLVQSEQQQPGGGWRDLLKALVSIYVNGESWMGELDNALSFWSPLLPTLCNGATCAAPEANPIDNAYKQIYELMHNIIMNPRVGNKQLILKRFQAFFSWVPGNGDPAEVSFGTLQVAINAGAAGWIVLGPVNNEGRLLRPGNANAFLLIRSPEPVETERGVQKNILAIVRGDACTRCDTEQNRQDIMSWLVDVVNFLINTTPESVGAQMGDQRVVVLAFTRSTNNVERLLESLVQSTYYNSLLKVISDQVLALTGLPIFFIWRSCTTSECAVYYDCTNDCKDQNGNPVSSKLLIALSCSIIGRECVPPTRKPKGLP